MLRRALQHIKEGFYIDVGAWSPDIDSVTRMFSEMGWYGVNIEPNPAFYAQLKRRRPRDVNLQVAVGANVGSSRIHLFHDTGLSTLDDTIANEHCAAGRTDTIQEVTVTTLNAVWREHISADQPVHFLKVDVEGLEREVLRGNDWTINRPWIVIVEATLPLTQHESHQEWEPILLDSDYIHVYSDGLNRFYIAREHSEIADAFKYPPNIFDDFVVSRTKDLMAQVDALSNRIAELTRAQEALQSYQTKYQEIAHHNQILRQQFAEFESWRIEAEQRYRDAQARLADLNVMLVDRDRQIHEASQYAARIENQYNAVVHSFFWRATSIARKAAASMPPAARVYLRRTAKATWWLVTPWRMPARMEFLRQRRIAQSQALERTIISQDPVMKSGAVSGAYARWITTIETSTYPVEPIQYDKPLVSFIILDTNSIESVSRTVNTLRSQRHRNWEVIAVCAGMESPLQKLFDEWSAADPRVLLVGDNDDAEGRAECLASAFGHAQGEYVAILDSGDLLAPGALNEIAATLRDVSHADIIYSDEDIQSQLHSREKPFFKPSWSPDLLYSFNYFGRLTLLRRSLVIKAGGVDVAAGAAAEWDINLRVSDIAQDIVRIPRVLCHRKSSSYQDRPVPNTDEARAHREVIRRYWERSGIGSTVKVETQSNGTQRVAWKIECPPLVSVIIPTKNKLELLRICVEGLLHGTDYANKEIIIVDTGSDDPDVLAYYNNITSEYQVRIVYFRNKFNYSAACNFGAARSRGELLLFLNNDIEIIDRDWLQELVRFAMRPGVGVVGTKLIYPSLELQHGGVSIGIHLAALMYRSFAGEDWGVFGSPEHPRNWLAIMGACQLVRRKVFDEVAGFDESYLIAMSDVSLCLKIWRAGYRIAYTPYACLMHHEGASRGKTNPAEDIRRLADDIRHFGIDEDPYLHPGLDGCQAIPSLLSQREASLSTMLVRHLSDTGSPLLPDHTLRLEDEGVCMRICGLPRISLLWYPQPAHKVSDIWSAARWCLDLLRTRADVRARFPRALSDGNEGTFFHWLIDGAGYKFGLTDIGIASIELLFAEDFGAAARQLFMFRQDVRALMPHGLTPVGQLGLFQWFMRHGRIEAGLRLEQIWWLFWQASEDPGRELVEAYKFTPIWQRLHPDGITVFGRNAFASWFASTYRAFEPWVVPQTWSIDLSPSEQIRVAYNSREDWRVRFPTALRDIGAARALIAWLKTDNAACSTDVQEWCCSIDEETVAAELVRTGVNVIGHFCYPSGLRVSVEALVKGMQEVGLVTALRDIRTDQKDDPYHVEFSDTENFDITIIHTQPEPFFEDVYERCDLSERAERTYRIAYWYWEFDSIPDSWLEQARNVDEVWAATEFVAKGLRDKLPIPVRTIFPGVQLGQYRRRNRAYFGLKDNEYTFLFTFHMMSIMERKNPIGLIRAFSSAFKPGDAVCLVLKTSFGDRWPEQIKELRHAASLSGMNIQIIDQVFTPDEVLSLMDTCDAYVSLHRSEGLGLTMAEAMLMGKPVIATNYSGNVDFMDETNSLLVPYELVKLGRPIPPYDENQHWAEPSVDEAAKLMRKVFVNQEWACELGRRAQESAKANLSVIAAGRRAAERINDIRATLPTRTRIF